MNPSGKKYLAEINRAGAEMEEREAKGLALLLKDSHKEIMSLRGHHEQHDMMARRHRADVQESLSRIATEVQRLHDEQGRLMDLLNGSSTAAAQVAARGIGETLTLMAMEQGELPVRGCERIVQPPRPRLGLVGTALFRLDLWLLSVASRHARSLQCH